MSSKRLNAVLRVRELQERRARGELAMTRRRHRAAEMAERRTWLSLDDRIARAARASGYAAPPMGGPYSLLGGRAVVESGVLAAATQHAATDVAAELVAEAQQRWTIAARRVEGLQRLTERVAAEQRDEEQRKAGNEVDDLVLARFGRDTGGAT